MLTRHIVLNTLYNARDLGGLPTKDGKTTKFGVFIRSEAPYRTSQSDINFLIDYGVKSSMDFRSESEMHSRPSSIKDILPYYPRPLFRESVSVSNEVPKTRRKPKFKKKEKQFGIDWEEEYINMLENGASWAKEVLTIASQAPGCLLYHCTTGKDRTGLVTMMILSIAGVSREDIAADYCVSQIYLEPVYDSLPPMNYDFYVTPSDAMLGLIDYLDNTYGGVLGYIRKAGVTEETIQRIRSKLVE